jgi:hypothetical protein
MALRVPEFGRKDGGEATKTLARLQKQLGETLGEVKEFAEEFRSKSDGRRQDHRGGKEKADKALAELTGLRGEITELSQKLAQNRRGGDDEPALKSLGHEVANHPDVRRMPRRAPRARSASRSRRSPALPASPAA